MSRTLTCAETSVGTSVFYYSPLPIKPKETCVLNGPFRGRTVRMLTEKEPQNRIINQ